MFSVVCRIIDGSFPHSWSRLSAPPFMYSVRVQESQPTSPVSQIAHGPMSSRFVLLATFFLDYFVGNSAHVRSCWCLDDDDSRNTVVACEEFLQRLIACCASIVTNTYAVKPIGSNSECVVLLLKLFCFFFKFKSQPNTLNFKKYFFAKAAFLLVQNWKQFSSCFLSAVEVGNFEKITYPPPLKKLMASELFHILQLIIFFSKNHSSTKHILNYVPLLDS